MHGRKKRGIQISEEERIKKNEQAAKIGQMISDFLAFRKDITKITDPLEYTAVMVKICPEINTIYNLRREIIEKTLGTLQPKDRYNFLLKELKLLLPLMQSNPKSYCLWHHRKWCIIKGSEIEKEDPTIEKLIVKQELMLCDQMLAKDERNFHVWNYRSWIVNTFKSENHALVDNELKFINSKLEHNFSNFSALHFKSKNLLSKYALYLDEHKDEKMEESQELEKIKDILIHRMPFETLKEEFEKVKTGLYMQSGEQSMWLYHKWLLDVISPIKVLHVRVISRSSETVTLALLLNRKAKGLSTHNITITDANENKLEFTAEALDKLEYSIAYKLIIKTPQNTEKLTIKMKNFDILVDEHKSKSLQEVIDLGIVAYDKKRLVSDRPLIVEIKDSTCIYHEEDSSSPRAAEYNQIIADQRKTIEELIELEPDNRFAHSQLIFMIETMIEPYSNSQQKLKERVELYKLVVKSSENLLAKNPKYLHKFTYFLKLYKFKLHALEALFEGKEHAIKELATQEDIRSINLTELADVLLLGHVDIKDNEVSPILALFQ